VGLGNVSRQKATPAPRTEREEGRYANFCEIGYSACEVLLEFGQREAGIHTRIYLSRECARMLSEALLEAIEIHSVPARDSVW
jgi:hypothetical protein